MHLLLGRLLLCTALLGTVGSTLRHYPHQLAYFNELAGGPYEGWRHVAGSSFDWGQDLLMIQELQRCWRLQPDRILLMLSSGATPHYLGVKGRQATPAAPTDLGDKVVFVSRTAMARTTGQPRPDGTDSSAPWMLGRCEQSVTSPLVSTFAHCGVTHYVVFPNR